MLVISISVVGDSLTEGLTFNFENTWFNQNTFKGSQQPALQHLLKKQAAELTRKFNKLLANTKALKHKVPEILIDINTFARSGLALAHYNPAAKQEFVAHQMFGPKVIAQQKDLQADCLLIALGTNDSQDFNTLAVEELLKLMDAPALATLLNNINEPALKERLQKAYDHLSSDDPFVSLMPNNLFARDENQHIREAAKASEFASTDLQAYIQDWETNKYYSKTADEIRSELAKLHADYIQAQVTDARGYPVSITWLLPPLLPKACLFPTYHQSYSSDEKQSKLQHTREIIEQFAADKGDRVIDSFQDACLSVRNSGNDSHGDDALHFTSAVYKKLSEDFQLTQIVLGVLENRAQALLGTDATDSSLAQAQAELNQCLAAIKSVRDGAQEYQIEISDLDLNKKDAIWSSLGKALRDLNLGKIGTTQFSNPMSMLYDKITINYTVPPSSHADIRKVITSCIHPGNNRAVKISEPMKIITKPGLYLHRQTAVEKIFEINLDFGRYLASRPQSIQDIITDRVEEINLRYRSVPGNDDACIGILRILTTSGEAAADNIYNKLAHALANFEGKLNDILRSSDLEYFRLKISQDGTASIDFNITSDSTLNFDSRFFVHKNLESNRNQDRHPEHASLSMVTIDRPTNADNKNNATRLSAN